MAKLHSASPREITSPFTRENYTQKHVITYTYSTEVTPDTRNVKYQPIFHGSYSMEVIPWLSYFFPSRHARSVVMSIFHCYVNIKRV